MYIDKKLSDFKRKYFQEDIKNHTTCKTKYTVLIDNIFIEFRVRIF